MYVGLRTTARIIARPLVLRLNNPGVDEHRERVFGFAGFRDPIDITRVVPRHEDFIRRRTIAEDLCP
jgi:hypothetical protein